MDNENFTDMKEIRIDIDKDNNSDSSELENIPDENDIQDRKIDPRFENPDIIDENSELSPIKFKGYNTKSKVE